MSTLSKRALKIHETLLEAFGEPTWRNPLPPVDELVSTILSQNTNDVNRDRAFDSLRAKFPTWESVRDAKTGDVIVEIDPKYFRPTEVDGLQADIRKAKKKLGWQPSVLFEDLVKVMVDHDLLQAGLEPPGEGIKILQKKDFGWTNHSITLQERIREGIG